MQRDSPVGGGNAANKEPAKFAARKGVLLREYHVLVVWSDGRREKVGRFLHKLDAVRWIAQESAEWLTQSDAAESSNWGDSATAEQPA